MPARFKLAPLLAQTQRNTGQIINCGAFTVVIRAGVRIGRVGVQWEFGVVRVSDPRLVSPVRSGEICEFRTDANPDAGVHLLSVASRLKAVLATSIQAATSAGGSSGAGFDSPTAIKAVADSGFALYVARNDSS